MSAFKISERQLFILRCACDHDEIHGGMGASFEGHICKSMVKRGWLEQIPTTTHWHYSTYKVTELGRAVMRQLRTADAGGDHE